MGDIEMQDLLVSNNAGYTDNNGGNENHRDDEASQMRIRTQMARGLLKWGEVEMPADFYTRFLDSYQEVDHNDMMQHQQVGHLSFGTHDVVPPQERRWYA